MATIKDIAKRAGVSVATVSYVLNNKRYVSPERKSRILKVIEELKYVPHAVARGLRSRKSKTIGLLVSDIANPFYPDVAKACEAIAHERGFNVIIMNTNDETERTIAAFSQIRDGKVDGLIITSALEQDRLNLVELLKGNNPCVLLYRYLEDLPMDMITVDNFNGGYEATSHLQQLGHRKIAFIKGIPGSWVTRKRLEGYYSAMKERNLAISEEWMPTGYARYQQSYDATLKLMNLPVELRPTAIINISDIGALGVLDAAYDIGLKVHDDLAVIGFDDLFISSTRSIQLSTVHIPRYDLAARATTLLLDRIMGKETGEFQNIVLPTRLVVRKTCGGK